MGKCWGSHQQHQPILNDGYKIKVGHSLLRVSKLRELFIDHCYLVAATPIILHHVLTFFYGKE
jgi:hypothetical protein